MSQINEENEIINEDPNPKKTGIVSRILAFLALLIMVGLIVAFIWCIFSGSKYIIQMLFLVIIYPVIVYVMVWLRKVFDRKED